MEVNLPPLPPPSPPKTKKTADPVAKSVAISKAETPKDLANENDIKGSGIETTTPPEDPVNEDALDHFGTRTTSSIPNFEGKTIDIKDLKSAKAQQKVIESIAQETGHSSTEINEMIEAKIAKQLPNGPKGAQDRARQFILAEIKSILDIEDQATLKEAMGFLKNNLQQIIQRSVKTSIISKDNRMQVYCCPPDRDPALRNYTLPDAIKNNANASEGFGYVHQSIQRNNPNVSLEMKRVVNSVLTE
jgi:hypothetical protein